MIHGGTRRAAREQRTPHGNEGRRTGKKDTEGTGDAARGTKLELENMESTDERGLRRNRALLPTFPQYRHGHGAPSPVKG